MTTQLSKEEVLRLAQMSGFYENNEEATYQYDGGIITAQLMKFSELVRKEAIAEEREAIAKICLDKRQLNSPEAINWNIALVSVVEAIRGR